MRLIDVYDCADAPMLLYELLKEREPNVNISHREMPTWEQHVEFMSQRPYAAWYMIEEPGVFLGAIYLTKRDEIGVFLFKCQRGFGYGRQAIELLMKTHPRPRFLANINPANQKSIAFFRKLGFTHIQNTYELHPESASVKP